MRCFYPVKTASLARRIEIGAEDHSENLFFTAQDNLLIIRSSRERGVCNCTARETPVSQPVDANTAKPQSLAVLDLEPSFDVGSLTVAYLIVDFPSPYPPVHGLDWVNRWAGSNHITVLRFKALRAVRSAGEEIKPLSVEEAAERAGSATALAEKLDQTRLSHARHKAIARGVILGLVSVIGAAALPRTGSQAGTVATKAGDELVKTRIQDAAFFEGDTNGELMNDEIRVERLDGVASSVREGYVFFPRDDYASLKAVVGLDSGSPTSWYGQTVSQPWPLGVRK